MTRLTKAEAMELRELHHNAIEAWHRFYNRDDQSAGTTARIADKAFYDKLAALTEGRE